MLKTNGTTTNTEESATTTNSQGARQNIGSKGYIAINSQEQAIMLEIHQIPISGR